MEKQTITGHLSSQQKEDIESYIYDRINDSLQYSGLGIVWHESVSFRGYFDDMDEICDENGKVCETLDTGNCEYWISEENESDFEDAFYSARNKACGEYRKKHEPNPSCWMEPLIAGMGG